MKAAVPLMRHGFFDILLNFTSYTVSSCFAVFLPKARTTTR